MHTPECYCSGKAEHNAEVFIDLWRHDILGVDAAEGKLFTMSGSGGSAGGIEFRSLLTCIRKSDVNGKLDHEDRIAAAAMLFHLTPRIDFAA